MQATARRPNQPRRTGIAATSLTKTPPTTIAVATRAGGAGTGCVPTTASASVSESLNGKGEPAPHAGASGGSKQRPDGHTVSSTRTCPEGKPDNLSDHRHCPSATPRVQRRTTPIRQTGAPCRGFGNILGNLSKRTIWNRVAWVDASRHLSCQTRRELTQWTPPDALLTGSAAALT